MKTQTIDAWNRAIERQMLRVVHATEMWLDSKPIVITKQDGQKRDEVMALRVLLRERKAWLDSERRKRTAAIRKLATKEG